MSNIYQFANFATASRDVKQNITADTVTANNLEIGTYIIDNLETNNISAISPNTEITINNNLDFDNHDIMNVGTLQAANIIGDITDDVIDVNIINPKDNTFISITGDLDLNTNNLTTSGTMQGIVKTNSISSISGNTIISNNNIDMTGSDLTADSIITDSIDSISGNGITISDDLLLDSNDITTTGTIQGIIKTNSVSSVSGDIGFNNNIDLNQNDINDCDNITARRIFLPAQTQTQNTSFMMHLANTQNCNIWLQADTDNSGESDLAYFYMTEDGGHTMHYIGGGNNTLKFISGSDAGTQGIVWQNATVVSASGNTLPTYTNISTGLNLTSSTFTISRNTNLSGNNLINIGLLDFQTQPTNDNTATRLLVVDSTNGNVKYRDASSILNNPFDQDLNTNDNVSFNNVDVKGALTNSTGDIVVSKSMNFLNMYDLYNVNNLETEGIVTLSNTSNDDTATNILLLDGSQNVKSRSVSSVLSDQFAGRGSVTQTGSIDTSVTINNKSGTITTVSTTIGAGSSDVFSVLNSECTSTSLVFANIVDYSAGYVPNGLPAITIDNVTNGSFRINIINNSTTDALNGVLKINFVIF